MITFPLHIAMHFFTVPIGALLLKRLHPKVIIILGMGINLLGLFLASMVTDFNLFVIFYAGL